MYVKFVKITCNQIENFCWKRFNAKNYKVNKKNYEVNHLIT